MLKAANDKDLAGVLEFCDNDLIGTRIACYCLCYGFDKDFFSLWINSDHDKIKAVVAKFYDSVTVKCENSCDFDEIGQFISMIGYKEIMCSEQCCRFLTFSNYETKKAYVFRENSGEYLSESLGEEYYKQLYSLISEAIPGSFSNDKEAYLSWLSDFSYRKRRGFGRSKGLIQDGELLSCVMTSSETNTAAILSGVACKSSSRKSGLGKTTVLSAVNELKHENKISYVIALNESAQGFYEHIGFEKLYNICLIKDK